MATRTSIANGNWSDAGTWDTGVPVLGDKVVIAHNSSAKNQFSTDAAGYAIGATNITLTGSVLADSYVVGESVQFAGDPNYYTITAWNSATKVLTISPLLQAIPAVATTVISRGHVVTVDTTTCVGGDDTSTGITVNGTLYFSRTANSQLKVRGELFVSDYGTFDRGRSTDPIPAAYTATCVLNDSASMSDGKWGFTGSELAWIFNYGTYRNRNAKLVNDVAIGATSARVTDGTGWAVGDRIVLAPTGTSATERETVTINTITLVSGTIYDITWTGGLSYAHKAKGSIGNFSSNVINTVSNTTYRSYWYEKMTTTTPDNSREAANVLFYEFVTNTTSSTFWRQAGFCIYSTNNSATNNPYTEIANFSFYQTNSGTGGYISGNHKARFTVSDFNYVIPGGSCVRLYQGGVNDIYRHVSYYASYLFVSGYSEGDRNPRMYNCIATGCTSQGFYFGGSPLAEHYDCIAYSSNYGIHFAIAPTVSFTRCQFGAGADVPTGASFTQSYIINGDTAAIGGATFTDCNFDATKAIVYNNANGYQRVLPSFKTTIVNKDADIEAQELYKASAAFYRDNTTYSRGKSSIKAEARVNNAVSFETIYIPASLGVPSIIKGRLRKNSAYGSSTRPSVTLSGLGITPQTFTMSDSVDTWEEFTFTATPVTADGNLELVFTQQSATSLALSYLDGIVYPPFVTYVDHYGYTWDPSNNTRTVDPVITQTNEAIVAAYTGISIAAGTITLTSDHSIQELYDYCQYYRVTNLIEPFFTSTDGVNFTSTYNLVLNGGNLTGTGVINMPANNVTIGTGNVSTVSIYAANGNTSYLNVSSLSGHSIILLNNTGTQVDYNASVTGTYSYFIDNTATGTWKFIAKKAGYEHQIITFTPATGGQFNYEANTPQKITADGLAMYTGATSSLVSVSFTGTTQATIDIGNGIAPLQATFDETEVALTTNAGMLWLAAGKDDNSIFNSASGDYLFLTDGWRIRRASAGDNNATLQAFCISTEGIIVDGTNGPVQFLTSDTPEAIAAAVWDEILSSHTITGSAGKILKHADDVIGNEIE